jgi:hypothetical protein
MAPNKYCIECGVAHYGENYKCDKCLAMATPKTKKVILGKNVDGYPMSRIETPKIKSEEEMREDYKKCHILHLSSGAGEWVDKKESADYWLSIIKERERGLRDQIVEDIEKSIYGSTYSDGYMKAVEDIINLLKQTK